MILVALAVMATAFIFLHLAKTKPVLRNVALALFATGFILAFSSAVRSFNPAKRSQRIYLNMHQERQSVQGEKLARLLAERDPPPGQVVYLLNRLSAFGDAHFEGMERGAGKSFPVAACYAGTAGLDPTQMSEYNFNAKDMAQALKEYPEADVFVFERQPPPGAFALPEMRECKPAWAVMSSKPNAPFEQWKEAGCLIAISDLPPSVRGSAINQKISGNVDKAFDNEFILHQ